MGISFYCTTYACLSGGNFQKQGDGLGGRLPKLNKYLLKIIWLSYCKSRPLLAPKQIIGAGQNYVMWPGAIMATQDNSNISNAILCFGQTVVSNNISLDTTIICVTGCGKNYIESLNFQVWVGQTVAITSMLKPIRALYMQSVFNELKTQYKNHLLWIVSKNLLQYFAYELHFLETLALD